MRLVLILTDFDHPFSLLIVFIVFLVCFSVLFAPWVCCGLFKPLCSGFYLTGLKNVKKILSPVFPDRLLPYLCKLIHFDLFESFSLKFETQKVLGFLSIKIW